VAELSDEMLMAYADGALDPVEHAAVEAAIGRHPEYQRKVEKFRATLKPVRRAFEEEPNAGSVQSLIASLQTGDGRPESAAADPQPGEVVFLRGRQAPARSRALWQYLPTAIAASLAALAGGGIGWLLHAGPPAVPETSASLVAFSDRGLLAQGALANVLETERSGAAIAARGAGGQSWRLNVSFTFRSVSREHCRRYEANSEVAGRYAGYACRGADGRWVVHAHMKLDSRAPGPAGFAPAAGSDDGALDAAIRAAMDGDVLQSGQEAELIAGRWPGKDN
jgi:hypothetical protein